ncbi:phosphatidate cytidylyltransferase [bacterium]|nr:phosphatidate cytidylyltransferase [bacterium]
MRELPKRIISALVFGPIVLAGLYFGGWFLFVLVIACSYGLLTEFRKVAHQNISNPEFWTILFLSVLWIFAATIHYPMMVELFIASVLILFLIELGVNKIDGTIEKNSLILFLFFYCGIMPSSFILVRNFGIFWGLLPVIMVWIVDTFAYWGGTLTGKHRLAEKLSPNKTIEGFFWGLLSGVGVAYGTILLFPNQNHLCIWLFVFITGIVGQLGDLFESKIKRQLDVKDMSSIMPGHGGIWDRTDSLLWVYPMTWLVLRIFR